jgi:hypothetical protein
MLSEPESVGHPRKFLNIKAVPPASFLQYSTVKEVQEPVQLPRGTKNDGTDLAKTYIQIRIIKE